MKTNTQKFLGIACGISMLVSTCAYGDIFGIGHAVNEVKKDVTKTGEGALHGAANTFGDGAKLGARALTAPAAVYLNVARVPFGGKPADVLKPFTEVAAAGGTTLKDANGVAIAPERFLYDKAGQFAQGIGGRPGTFVFDVATFSQRFYGELGYTTIEVAANTLKGQNPLAVVATPLAAAIHEAHEKYQATAQPLPDDVRQGLKDFFTDDVLKKAKYAVGSVDITLPDFIGQAKKFQGDHYAVVVEDIIVFNGKPPSFKANPFWWGHEVTHVEQWCRDGTEMFAFNYIRDFGSSIEGEANAKGAKVFTETSKASGGGALAYSLGKFYKVGLEQGYQFEEIIVSRCVFVGDSNPASYVITSKGNILAVDPLSGRSIKVGQVKPPKFTGAAWTFSTPKIEYSVSDKGEIFSNVPLKSPSGEILCYSEVGIGKVEYLQ